MMNLFRRFCIAAGLIFSLISPMLVAHAQSTALDGAKDLVHKTGVAVYGDNSTGTDAPATLRSIVTKIIKMVLSLLGLIFLVLVLYGGFLWMFSQGNSDQIEKARDTLVHAIIGLVIVLSAYAITVFVFEQIGSSTGTTFNGLPQAQSGAVTGGTNTIPPP